MLDNLQAALAEAMDQGLDEIAADIQEVIDKVNASAAKPGSGGTGNPGDPDDPKGG